MDDLLDPRPIWDRDLAYPPPWQDKGREIAFKTDWMTVTRHDAVAPTGAPADYAVMRPVNMGVGVLPIHADGRVTLVGQHRFPLMRWSWEMPEGGCPEGEDPLEACKRELAEEAGLVAGTWREALSMDLSNSITDERGQTWLAWDLAPAPTAPDPTEALLIATPPFMVLLDEIALGRVTDALTVATAMRAYHMARENELPGWLAHAMLSRSR
jgi:8-oxo-dGTP pyrophosphatase MutT (NUDIX family)